MAHPKRKEGQGTEERPEALDVLVKAPGQGHWTRAGRPRSPTSFLPTAGRYTNARQLEEECELQKRVLGEGVSGQVRLALCRATHKPFAVKSFTKKDLSVRRMAEMKREVDVYLSVDHPHIARLECVYESDEAVHLVMERLDGGELFDRLRERHQFTEEATAVAIRQVLLAVAYLHSHKIVHRDLKLENVLYERRDSDFLKVIDFGFATKWDGRTKMTQRCGTLHYAAPEVLAGAYTDKADMWSVGAMAYMLLTGKALYVGEDNAVQKKVRAGKVDYSRCFPKLSFEARDFVQSLLLPDPWKRLGAVSALQHPWIRRHHKAEALPELVLHNLKTFAEGTQLRRALLVVMAWSMRREDEADARRHFLALDTEGDGVITLGELRRALRLSSVDFNAQEGEALLRGLTNTAALSYREYLAASISDNLEVRDFAARAAFARFDLRKQGRLSMAALRSTLGVPPAGVSFEEMMREVDPCAEDSVAYSDFRAFLQLSEASPKCRRVSTFQVVASSCRKPSWLSPECCFAGPLRAVSRNNRRRTPSERCPSRTAPSAPRAGWLDDNVGCSVVTALRALLMGASKLGSISAIA